MIRSLMGAVALGIAVCCPLGVHAASLSFEQVGGYTPNLLLGDIITITINVELPAGTTLSNLTLIPAASGSLGGLTTSSFTPGDFLPGTASLQVTQLGSLQEFNLVATTQNTDFLTGSGVFASFDIQAVAVGSGILSVQGGQFGWVSGPFPSFPPTRLSYTVEQNVGSTIVPLPAAVTGGLALMTWLGIRRRRADASFS